jgi:multicomponent Na+:H+ antiporter subunit C
MGSLLSNFPYVASVILFGIGMYILLCDNNLIKKIIGSNIMSCAVFLLFIAAGNIRGGVAPIIGSGEPMINPIPSALILTGIVVSLSVNAFALALVVRIYHTYHTVEADRLAAGKEEA